MDVELKPMSPDDRRAVMDIFNHYVAHTFAAFFEHPLPYEFFDVMLKMIQGYPSVTARDKEDKMAGFGFLRALNPIPTFSRTAQISYFLKPEYTDKGLGKAMLGYLLEKGTEKGLTSVLASVSSLNEKSIAFHKKNGFVECGRFRQVVEKKGRVFDVIYLQKML